MFCNQCGNRNPRGSKFCRHCGVALTQPGAARPIPDEEYEVSPQARARQQSQLRSLLDSAFVFSEKGDLPAAIHACRQAVDLEPTSATAHSFLALLYERAEDTMRAMEEYQHALRLNPNSTLDRDSLDRLRRKQGVPPPPRPVHNPFHRPSPYFEATPVIAAATFAIVVLLGAHRLANGRTQEDENRKRALARASQAREIATPPGNPIPPPRYFAQAPNPMGLGASSRQPGTMSGVLSPGPGGPQIPSEPPPSLQPGPVMAEQNPQGRWVDVPTNPNRIVRPPVSSIPPDFAFPNRNSFPGSEGNRRGNPADSLPAQPRANTEADAERPSGPGSIRVTVSKAPEGKRPATTPEGGGSAKPTVDPLRPAEHERIANQSFLRGDVDDAVDNYNLAIATTSPEHAGPLHQQLAGAYLKKKMTAEAIAEYRKALECFRQQKNAGVQVSLAEAGIKACQTAINTWEPLLR